MSQRSVQREGQRFWLTEVEIMAVDMEQLVFNLQQHPAHAGDQEARKERDAARAALREQAACLSPEPETPSSLLREAGNTNDV